MGVKSRYINTDCERWAFTFRAEMTTNELFVLVIIAQHYNEAEHRSWPSVATLMDLTRLSRSTVFKVLASLQAKGLIQVEQWYQTDAVYDVRQVNNRYCLPLYDALSVASPKPVRVMRDYEQSGRVNYDRVEV